MTDFWAVRKGDALHITDAESAVVFSKLPFGKPLRVKVQQPRSGPQHRLYWTLVHRIAEAIGAEPENVSDILKIETGHCVTVKSKKHGEVRLPRSISFAAMDQTRFREFFDRCLIVICETWGIERQDILAAVEDLIIPESKYTSGTGNYMR